MRKRALKELLFENIKGSLICELQISQLQDDLENTNSEQFRDEINRKISERLSFLDRYKTDVLKIRSMLKDSKNEKS